MSRVACGAPGLSEFLEESPAAPGGPETTRSFAVADAWVSTRGQTGRGGNSAQGTQLGAPVARSPARLPTRSWGGGDRAGRSREDCLEEARSELCSEGHESGVLSVLYRHSPLQSPEGSHRLFPTHTGQGSRPQTPTFPGVSGPAHSGLAAFKRFAGFKRAAAGSGSFLSPRMGWRVCEPRVFGFRQSSEANSGSPRELLGWGGLKLTVNAPVWSV